MPHVIVEYSANIEAEVPAKKLLEDFHRAAIATGVADPVGVRSRLERRDVFMVGDGDPENAFVHVVARVRQGRTVEQRKMLCEALLAQANKTLEPAFAVRPLALTVEVHEIDPEFRLMRNGLRERAQSSAA